MPGVKYDFIATGYGSVIRAFENIEKAAINSKKAVDASLTSASGGRGAGSLGAGGGGGAGRGGPSYQEKLARRVAADQEKAAAREKRTIERTEASKAKADQRSAAAQERTAARETRVAERVAAAKQRSAAKAAEKSAKSSDKAAEAERKNTIRLARERVKMADEEERDRIKRERSATRSAEATAKARQRIGEKETRDRLRKQERDSKATARAGAKEAKEKQAGRDKMVGRIGDAITGAMAGAAISAVLAAGVAGKQSSELQTTSRRIAIAARSAGGPLADVNKLRQGFEATANATPGVKAADVADAVQRFISLTGDMDTAVKGQGVFATVSSATGADVGDVAEAAASLSQQFDIKGLEDMKEALAALTFQGKNGAFELKDAAGQFQRLAASGAAFGIPKGVKGVKTLGGLTQIARSGTGSAEQAATAVENLLTNMKVKQGELAGQGVNVYDKAGKTRDIRDLIVESIAKVGGNDIAKKQSGLSKIFGEQGIRAINPLVAKYNDTFRDTKGTDAEKTAAAMARLRGEFEKAIDAPGTYADVQDDAAIAQQDASAKMTASWEQFSSSIGTIAVPAIDKFAAAMGMSATALKETFGEEKEEFYKKGGKGEADAANATIAAIESDMKAKGISEKDLDIGQSETLRMARETSLAFANKQAAGDKFNKLVAGGATAAELEANGFGASAKDMSLDSFTKQYAQLGLGDNSNPEDVQAAMANASGVASKVIESGGKSSALDELMMRTFGSENAAQEELRNKYQVEMGGEGTVDIARNPKGMGEVKTVAVQEQLDSLASSLARVNAVAVASNGGTIFAGQ